VHYLEQELLQKYKINFNYKEWIYQPGIPENCIDLKSNGFEQAKTLALTFSNEANEEKALQKWMDKSLSKRSKYSVQEWLTFLRHLPSDIDPFKMSVLDKGLGFSQWTNAEIQFEWFLKSISAGYTDALPYLKSFLEKIGRRKFILPLYEALYNNKETKENALEWFQEFEKNYHAVSRNSIVEALELSD
jgi:hypothetical protein